MIKIPLDPVHPERTCWGCDKYCPANDLRAAATAQFERCIPASSSAAIGSNGRTH
jgi:hypothetical protein